MSIKASRFYGIGLAALTIGAFAACSSDDPVTTPGTAGTASVAGTGAGGTPSMAGTGAGGTPTAGTGAGGTPTAGTGAGGTPTAGAGGGGGAGMGPFTCKGTKPTSSLITSFADTVAKADGPGDFTFMAGLPGGTYRYPAVLVTEATGMALNVKGMVTEYAGIGLYFNDCIDAGTAGTTGISFKIKAAALGTGTMVNFRVQTNATLPIDVKNAKGACMGMGYPDCEDNRKDIPVTATETEVTVLWADLMGGVKNLMPAAFDPKEITGLQWALPWAEAAVAYPVDLTVDEVKFIGGTFTGGGGGGGGGAGGGGAGGGGAGGGGAGGGGNGGTGGTP